MWTRRSSDSRHLVHKAVQEEGRTALLIHSKLKPVGIGQLLNRLKEEWSEQVSGGISLIVVNKGAVIGQVCFVPVWHNLWGYRWSQQILKSYQLARNHKFSRQKCRNCNKNDVFYFYDKMSWYVMICMTKMSWYVIICLDMSWYVISGHFYQLQLYSLLWIAFLFFR